MYKNILKRFSAAAIAAVTFLSAVPYTALAASSAVLYEKKDVQQIANGLTYEKSRRLYPAGWMDVYVLTLDATRSDLALDVIEAVDGLGLKRNVETLAKTNGAIAAVNGDFFGAGTVKSSMGQVAESGKMVAAQNYYNGSENRYAGLFIDNEGVPFIDYVKSTMGFYCNGNSAFVLGAKNKATDFSKPVYFDRSAIKDTAQLDKTFNKLTKIVVEDGVITKISAPGETVTVPENGYLIVMNNATRESKISWYSVGMQVNFDEREQFVFRPNKSISSIEFGISGGGELLRNGEIVNNGLIIGEKARNPRTMIGINKDKTRVYIVCIDGRANGIGATHAEAAGIMKEYGAYDAIHFDGGGSTTMVVQQEFDDTLSVVNTPSEGSLRAVANGIGIKATGEEGVPNWVKPYIDGDKGNILFKDFGNKINVNLFDGALKSMVVDKGKLTFKSSLAGTWEDNIFTPSEEGSGTITVGYGELTGVIDVTVLKGASAIVAEAERYAVDVDESTALSAALVNKDGYNLSIDPSEVKWSVDDEEIGTISNGVFTGKSKGLAKITASSHDVSTQITIAVGKSHIAVTGLESYRNQKIYTSPESGNVKGSSSIVSGVGHDGESSLQINYTFEPNMTTTQAVYSGFENNPLILPSNASDIMLWYKGDGSDCLLKAVLKDGNGTSRDVLLADNLSSREWKKAKVSIPTELTSPVTLDKLYVASLNTGADNLTGTIYVDDVTVLAPTQTGGSSGNNIKDYMNADLDSFGSDYELVTAFGATAGGNSANVSKVLTQMSSGSKAMAFAGATNISNSTGVAAVTWKNAYETNGTGNISFVSLATGSGSLRSANANQFKYLQEFVSGSSKQNIIVLMDRYLWGSGAISDSRERDAVHDILKTAVHESNKNIIVLSSVGESNYTNLKDGVRYINLAGIDCNQLQYLKIKANSSDMYYEFENVK